jgi:sarcosine oxidase/L-pipecolate oxidase
VVNCLDKRQHCAALFIDLSKAFDTVVHSLLIQKLASIGLDQAACNWCENHLTDVSTDGVKSGFLETVKGVPQGLIFGPVISTVYMNNINLSVKMFNLQLYADNIVVYANYSLPSLNYRKTLLT